MSVLTFSGIGKMTQNFMSLFSNLQIVQNNFTGKFPIPKNMKSIQTDNVYRMAMIYDYALL